jgi:hypothetical protein
MEKITEYAIIDSLLDQGHQLEEAYDILNHINEEIRRGNNLEEIFDMYSLDIDLITNSDKL